MWQQWSQLWPSWDSLPQWKKALLSRPLPNLVLPSDTLFFSSWTSHSWLKDVPNAVWTFAIIWVHCQPHQTPREETQYVICGTCTYTCHALHKYQAQPALVQSWRAPLGHVPSLLWLAPGSFALAASFVHCWAFSKSHQQKEVCFFTKYNLTNNPRDSVWNI